MMARGAVFAVDAAHLHQYPLGSDDRLDSHSWIPWERRRWLNSDMCLRGTPECKALYFDLICVAYEQAPMGTLPNDHAMLAKLARVDGDHFRALCQLQYGPLHQWEPCLCGTEVRLMHPFILAKISTALAQREENRARAERANARKRVQRLRELVAGFHTDLAKNDAAVSFMDGWLQDEGCGYRDARWVERAIRAWSDRTLDARRRGGSG